MKQIPFRYPDEVDEDLSYIAKNIFSWGGSKNKVILKAVEYLAACVRKIKKQHPKIDEWKVKDKLDTVISENRSGK